MMNTSNSNRNSISAKTTTSTTALNVVASTRKKKNRNNRTRQLQQQQLKEHVRKVLMCQQQLQLQHQQQYLQLQHQPLQEQNQQHNVQPQHQQRQQQPQQQQQQKLYQPKQTNNENIAAQNPVQSTASSISFSLATTSSSSSTSVSSSTTASSSYDSDSSLFEKLDPFEGNVLALRETDSIFEWPSESSHTSTRALHYNMNNVVSTNDDPLSLKPRTTTTPKSRDYLSNSLHKNNTTPRRIDPPGTQTNTGIHRGITTLSSSKQEVPNNTVPPGLSMISSPKYQMTSTVPLVSSPNNNNLQPKQQLDHITDNNNKKSMEKNYYTTTTTTTIPTTNRGRTEIEQSNSLPSLHVALTDKVRNDISHKNGQTTIQSPMMNDKFETNKSRSVLTIKQEGTTFNEVGTQTPTKTSATMNKLGSPTQDGSILMTPTKSGTTPGTTSAATSITTGISSPSSHLLLYSPQSGSTLLDNARNRYSSTSLFLKDTKLVHASSLSHSKEVLKNSYSHNPNVTTTTINKTPTSNTTPLTSVVTSYSSSMASTSTGISTLTLPTLLSNAARSSSLFQNNGPNQPSPPLLLQHNTKTVVDIEPNFPTEIHHILLKDLWSYDAAHVEYYLGKLWALCASESNKNSSNDVNNNSNALNQSNHRKNNTENSFRQSPSKIYTPLKSSIETNNNKKSSNVEIFYTLGGYSIIVGVMKRWVDNAKIQAECSTVLFAVCNSSLNNSSSHSSSIHYNGTGGAELIQLSDIVYYTVYAGAIESIIKSMEWFRQDLDVQLSGCNALKNLVSIEDGVQTFMKSSSNINIIVNAMKEFPVDIDLQYSALFVMYNISSDAYKEVIINAGAVGVMAIAHELHAKQSSKVQALARKALVKLLQKQNE